MGLKKNESDNQRESGDNKEACSWAGKYRFLVKTRGLGLSYEFLVVDLKQNNIVTKHPGAVWSDNWIISAAVLNKGIVSVMNIGVDGFENRFSLLVKEQDHVHSSNASTTSLDLTKTPPKWSGWTHAPELNFARSLPCLVSLQNKIFAFSGTPSDDTDKAEVYEINKFATCKWDVISTVPHDGHFVSNVITDPDNHRLIAYFCKSDSLHAYYHKLDKWILIHQNICGDGVFSPFLSADQVVANVIYFFRPLDQRFEAYDIFANKWLNVHWFQFDHVHKRDFTTGSQLVYLGNHILCLTYSYSESMESRTMMQFLRLSIKRVEQDVQLTPVTFHLICTDSYGLADTFIPL